MSSRQILLGRYKILSLLGKGSSGQVFKVEDRLAPGCILAAKAFSPPVSPARLEQIRAEFRALTSLAHPNILRAHDLHAVPGLEPYVLTSEMVEGRPLLDVALDLPWRRALGLFRPICSALQHLHTRGMVHRDISSSNILVEQTTALLRPVLMDLGLTARHGLRLGSRRAGTIHYIPPEVLDDQPAGKEGDLYAVGILLYRILAGRFPFTGGTLPQLEEAIRRSDPPPLAEQAPALPFSLCTAVERLLNREPARRFPDAASLWQAIQPYSDLNASDIHLPLPPPASWPLAGRQREMARITATLDRPALLSGRRPARQVQVILLSGPQGSGKSRLLAETKRYGQLQGLPSVLVSCRSLLPRPLGLISWVVQALLQLVGSRLEGQKPLGTILETHKEIMRHLARVDTGNEPSHEQDREAFCLEEEIPPLLRQLSEVQPFVLAVDDLEAADTPSAHCLERLLMKVPGAFVLVLAGHTERIQALADLEPQADRPTLLMVPPLRPGEIASFLSEFSPRFRAPETMAAELHRVSCGRPAFLTALLQRLFETIPGSEQMPTAALQEMELPSCISSWAVTQLSALTPLEMALLQILAAAQEGMAPQDLHDLLPSPHTEPALKEALESLMERGLAARQEDCRRAELSATHPLVRRLVVEQMEKAHLQRVHGKLADVILARPAEIEAGQTDHLAFHLLKAGRMTEAARWAVTAGRTALAHGSLEKAASLFRTALTHLGPGDQVLQRETLQSLGRILADLGQFPDATHLLEQLVREA
ncbi:MAG: serine/threonine-protein kinase PknK, partial [Acidobacteriota bacterium]